MPERTLIGAAATSIKLHFRTFKEDDCNLFYFNYFTPTTRTVGTFFLFCFVSSTNLFAFWDWKAVVTCFVFGDSILTGSGRSANNFCGWYFWCFGRRGSVSIAMTSRNTLRLLVTDVLFTTNEQFLLWNFSSKAWKLAKVCVRAWRQDILCKREKTEAWRLPLLRLWWSVPQVTSFYADIPTMREIFWRFFNFVSKPGMKI